MPDPPNPELRIRSSRLATWVLLVFLGIEVVLVLLDVFVGQAPHVMRPMRRLCNMAGESSMANWVASAQTLLVAVVAWLVGVRAGAEGASRFRRVAWAVIAGFFLFMALDDGSKMHERLGTLFERYRERGGQGLGCCGWLQDSLGSYHWIALLGPIFAGMGLFMLVFLWRELRTRAARLTLLLALGCFAVAVGLDYLEGIEGAYVGLVRLLRMDIGPVSHYAKVLEEVTEMFGTTLFLVTFIQHLTREGALVLRFGDDAEGGAE
jgi:hypothetical protein